MDNECEANDATMRGDSRFIFVSFVKEEARLAWEFEERQVVPSLEGAL